MKINITKINSIDLSNYKNFCFDYQEFSGQAGKEHYKLLSLLSSLVDNQIIIDIGTHLGASATALATNKSNQVYSFDVEDRISKYENSSKSISNINFNLVNLFEEHTRKPYEDLILKSKIIFLDIDPHHGVLEYEFYQWLCEKQYKGILIFDDIHYFEGMRKNLWSKIPDDKKQDITHLGHWSGTGVIQFNKVFNFE